MGLKWSTPNIVNTKIGKRLLMSANFPSDKSKCNKLWKLRNLHKEELSNAGFSVSKYSNKWTVNFWYKIDITDSMDMNAEACQSIFNSKKKYWEDRYTEIIGPLPELSDDEVLKWDDDEF